MDQVDLLVVGGGINGTGIARDAAGRGLSVLLVEKDDLAAHTSSASSKLIHGGLRYLEQFEFKLVRESLAERERLLRAAPHIVHPLEFVIPISQGSRPSWMLRAGLFLYDHLRRRTILPASAAIHLADSGLRPEIDRGLSYWDCQVQDSRLVVLNAVDAAERGAVIRTHTEMAAARREAGRWIARLRSSGHEHSVEARALVNAAGPWADELFGRVARGGTARHLRLVKGSHIVLRRLHDGERAFLLQNGDGRVVFAIPFEEKFTLVGTTDVECAAPAEHPAISEEETDYLLETVRRYFVASASRDDIVWSYSGIRALCDGGSSEPSKASRDYALDLEASGPPLLNVFGGKITTYRHLAEQVLDRLAAYLPATKGAWTRDSTLPGGDIPNLDVHAYTEALADRLPALPRALVRRLVRTYGTRSEQLLEGVRRVDDLGERFGAGLYAREVDYLVANEWARTAEDILYRRTKLGLHLPGSAGRLGDYLAAVVPSPGSPARRRLRRPAPG